MSSKRLNTLRARAARVASTDLVMEWQRSALDNLGRRGRGWLRRVVLQVELSGSFLLIGALAALPLAGGRAAIAALALLSAVVVQMLPGLLLLGGASTTRLVLDARGAELLGAAARPLRAVLVLLLGTFLNVAVATALLLLARGVEGHGRLVSLLQVGATIMAAWGAVQVLPLLPFQAGALLAARLPPRVGLAMGTASLALIVSGGFLAIVATARPSLLVVTLASAAFAVGKWWETIGQLGEHSAGLPGLVTRMEQALQRGNRDEAIRLARDGLAQARSRPWRTRLCRALAWGAIGEGDVFLAHSALTQLPPEGLSVHLVAAYLHACRRFADGEALLMQARGLGQRSRETTKLLLELLFVRGAATEAEWLALEDAPLLDGSDWSALEAAGFASVPGWRSPS